MRWIPKTDIKFLTEEQYNELENNGLRQMMVATMYTCAEQYLLAMFN